MRKRRQGHEELEEDLVANAEGRGAGDESDEPAGRHASQSGETRAMAPTASPAGPASGSRRVTPVDIQQKVFRSAFRGYAEREVDVFLDEVTEEMARLLAENRTVRDQLQRAEMRATTPLGFADDRVLASAREEAALVLQQARDDADRIVRQARDDAEHVRAGDQPATPVAPAASAPPRDFIHREREFLQRMAELIQSHAEAVREDLRRTRPGAEPVLAEPQPMTPPDEAPGTDTTPGMENGPTPAATDEAAAALGSAEVGMAEPGPAAPIEPPDAPEHLQAEPSDAPAPAPQAEQNEAGGPAVDFAVDLERGQATGQQGDGDELLPWETGPSAEEPEAAEHAPQDDVTVVGDAETTEDAVEAAAPSAASALRRFGNAPAGGALHGSESAAPAPWERRPADEREEEGRSLRELFWGED